jgi:hypothetical protein
MDANQLMTVTIFVIVITVGGTIALAVIGYLAFRLRERKQPVRPGAVDRSRLSGPYFFERIRVPAPTGPTLDSPLVLHSGSRPGVPVSRRSGRTQGWPKAFN